METCITLFTRFLKRGESEVRTVVFCYHNYPSDVICVIHQRFIYITRLQNKCIVDEKGSKYFQGKMSDSMVVASVKQFRYFNHYT